MSEFRRNNGVLSLPTVIGGHSAIAPGRTTVIGGHPNVIPGLVPGTIRGTGAGVGPRHKAGDDGEAARDDEVGCVGAAFGRSGRATLVGAGPGSPDLLTLRAARAIGSADVVLFDALIDLSILDLAPPSARRIDVGKRCGRHAMAQAAINALILRHARAGAHVVRLKGGDPFVFGRGGEELDTLRAAGIPVEVVPGVTAACAAAASLQIPLTHRDIARSLHFVTGHGSDGSVPGHDWTALATAGGTICAYMASRTLPTVSARLIAAGMAASTPAVAVENASRADERQVVGTLGTLPALLAEAGMEGPTIVVIGAVVALGARVAVEAARAAA